MNPLDLARAEKSEYDCIATCNLADLPRQVDLAYRIGSPAMEVRVVKVNRHTGMYHVRRRDLPFMDDRKLEERDFSSAGESEGNGLAAVIHGFAQEDNFAECVALAQQRFGTCELYVRKNTRR